MKEKNVDYFVIIRWTNIGVKSSLFGHKIMAIIKSLYFQQGILTKREGSVLMTSLFRSAALEIENIFYFFTKQATPMRRSTVLRFPLQLVFPVFRVTI